MGNTKVTQAARAKARERRVALARDRAERDARIEAGAATVFAGLAARAAADTARDEAERSTAEGLEQLLGEALTVGQVAELCELTVSEVQRLVRRHRDGRRASGGSAQPAPAAAGDVS